MHRPPYGDTFRKNQQFYRMLEVLPQIFPNKTVKVNPGSYTKNGKEVVEFIGANTHEIQPPSIGAKWVLITLNAHNIVAVLEGEGVVNSPIVPQIDSTSLPLAAIYYKSTDTVITADMIYDIRPFFSIYFNTENYVTEEEFTESLTQAITALQDVVAEKAHMIGTISSEFTLNFEESGAVATDAFLSVNRGSETKVSLRWNESENKWQYTNDGVGYIDFGNEWGATLASDTSFGTVKLSTIPEDAENPISVGNNDVRLLTEEEKSDLLNNKYNQEFHISADGDDDTGNGSESRPFKTIAKAISLNNNSTSSAIYLHKASAENLDLANVDNICFIGISAPNDSQVTAIYGNHSISGTSTRIKFVNISFVGTDNTIPVFEVRGSNGRHYFQNVTFGFSDSNTTTPVVSFIGTNQRWHEFNNCFIDGILNLHGTPANNTVVRIVHLQSWKTEIQINHANYFVLCYDLARLKNIEHNSGKLILRNIHDFSGNNNIAINSTSNTEFLIIDNCNFKYTQDNSYKLINKTGTCPYILNNSNHDVENDILTGTVEYASYDIDINNTSTVDGFSIHDAFNTININKVNIDDSRLFADEAEKDSVLNLATDSVKRTDDTIITGQFDFAPDTVKPPFKIGVNALNQMVVGLNANYLNGMESSEFVSSANATGQIFLTDVDIPSNIYRLEIKSGILTITPVI